MKHHPDFYADDDDRPRFCEMSENEQEAIMSEFFRKYPLTYKEYYREALSQLPDGNTVSERREYVAKCIAHNYADKIDWVP